MKSYAELQHQHITADLRQRQVEARRAALTAGQLAADELATATPVVSENVIGH